MSIRRANLCTMADMAEHCASPEVAIHLHPHLYQIDRVRLQWYDAFIHPFYICKEISEERVQKFCTKLGLDYETYKEGEPSAAPGAAGASAR